MKELELHEQLEMSVLDEMRKSRVLDQVSFGGGTMLRLCYDLPRFSVDLDFYLKRTSEASFPWTKKITQMFQKMGSEITDHHKKHYTFLWEIRFAEFPRRLKIEIRKDPQQSEKTQLGIAHSQFSRLQVRLRTLTLSQMWFNKVKALEARDEIRDAYDLEFLTRRGAGDFRDLPPNTLKMLRTKLEAYGTQDYKAKLGPLLPAEERKLILDNRFDYLKSKLSV